ncbi:PadR family transcriptional regulator [Halalkalibacter akibai]|uniref:Transcriptional regulator n=1 Tax=Halalkalibacter akibai (strain ATCC 43226 / DSM 21942 / CIP 109018 / JCM 9157 / 1139) TaxID=1236973 RepID=W4QMH6_HALA3|nr:PadR family transcriptional regulator [Halalkalibacter akibai]GAE33296.1 transcriptional regulator [Halalkalibacter akibai JCM 9157]
MDKEMMKGSIDILILSVVNRSDSYGYEIVKILKQQSDNVYDMSEGTLYPALKRLENKDFIEAYWGESNEGGRRKYYRITENGKKELTRKVSQWKEINILVSKVTEGWYELY